MSRGVMSSAKDLEKKKKKKGERKLLTVCNEILVCKNKLNLRTGKNKVVKKGKTESCLSRSAT